MPLVSLSLEVTAQTHDQSFVFFGHLPKVVVRKREVVVTSVKRRLVV